MELRKRGWDEKPEWVNDEKRDGKWETKGRKHTTEKSKNCIRNGRN